MAQFRNMNLTKNQALNIIENALGLGYVIPYSSNGNGGSGFGWLPLETSMKALKKSVANMRFREVPRSEWSEDFSYVNDLDLDDFDTCVEFYNSYGYSEQYLLWDIDYFLD